MALLFIPEFTPEQLAGIVRDLAQPLFHGLALFFFIALAGGGTQRRRGGLFIRQLTARHILGGGRLCGPWGLGLVRRRGRLAGWLSRFGRRVG